MNLHWLFFCGCYNGWDVILCIQEYFIPLYRYVIVCERPKSRFAHVLHLLLQYTLPHLTGMWSNGQDAHWQLLWSVQSGQTQNLNCVVFRRCGFESRHIHCSFCFCSLPQTCLRLHSEDVSEKSIGMIYDEGLVGNMIVLIELGHSVY